MFTRPEQSRFWLVIGFVVRRRAELTVITVTWLVIDQLETKVTPGLPGWMTPAQWAWLLMVATLAVVVAVPASRRFTLGRATAVVMRHRVRACFLQTRTWTANGRLPFLVWSRPTPVGVRVRVWLPAGLSVNDLERIIEEIGAACWAREARITPMSGQAALVWVDIVRRDPLGAAGPLSPPVVDHLDSDRHPAWPPTAQSATNGTAIPTAPGTPLSTPSPHGRVDTTKTTSTARKPTGLPITGRMNAEAAEHYADPNTHLGRLIAYAWQLGGRPSDWTTDEQRERWHDTYGRLRRWTHMLGFGGHFATKSRRYSTTHKALRAARREWRRATRNDWWNRHHPAIDDQADDTETTLIVADLHLAGIGWNTTADAYLAAAAAARARAYRVLAREEHTTA